MNSKVLDLRNPNYDTQKRLTQRLLEIKDTKSPECKKHITELLKIRIIRDDDGKVIRVHHVPEEVIVKPKARIIEIHDSSSDDGSSSSSLTETYRLVKSNLSWSEDNDSDYGEVVLDLRVKNFS
ncbi:hypothetical protein [Nitrosopumilus sp.]|uniref:hypothetical protein n=1 Tax=Nitrosopumilus sp. TaxID=2024843 RepID=UPI0029311D35|nr:hypothetical protein [Nitrosopumilus sp.]